MIDTKRAAIVQLLREGKNSTEIINLGFKKGTVYSAQRGWKQKQANNTGEKSIVISEPSSTLQCIHTPEIQSNAVGTLGHKQSISIEPEINYQSAIEQFIASAYNLGKGKLERCPSQENGICMHWQWGKKEEIPSKIGEPVQAANSIWRIKPSPIYCILCTGSIENTIDGLIEDIFKNPLFGIRDKFTCECGAKGEVEVTVKCTNCGKESCWSG